MEVLRYRGRVVTDDDVVFIRDLIAAHPQSSRRALSAQLCAAWSWNQANGAPRDMVCRSLMLALHRAGHIQLPPVRHVSNNPLARRQRPTPASISYPHLCGRLPDLGPLVFRQVRRTADESLFNGLIEAHHYLGYTQPVGEHLKFIIYAAETPVACFAWSSAPRHLVPRDRFIGWSLEARRRNICLVAYNTRFLILPWVKVPHLASHLLSRMTRMLPRQWEAVYGHRVHFAHTFVDTERFAGTCYLAANWVRLGQSSGRGKNCPTWTPNRSRKDVLGYALTPRFRELLAKVDAT